MSRSELETDRAEAVGGLPAPAGPPLLPPADFETRLAVAGLSPAAVIDVIADAGLALPADLVVVLLLEPCTGRLVPAAIRHVDPDRAALVAKRLGSGLQPLPDRGLPVDAPALPEPVRSVIAEELDGLPTPRRVTVSPIGGRLSAIGVLVLARRQAAFTDTERGRVAAAGRLGGAALEFARLAEQARREQALNGMLGDAVVTTDLSGTVLGWNPAAERLYGVPVAEALGRPADELVRPAPSGGPDPAALRRIVLREGGWSGRLRLLPRSGDPTGRALDVEARISLFRDAAGGPAGTLTVIREVAGVESGAGERTRLAQELLDALDERAALLDPAGRVVAANARWRAGLTDRDRCACGPVREGDDWVAALLASAEPAAAELGIQVGQLLRGERGAARVECRCAAAGHERTMAVEVVPVGSAAGGPDLEAVGPGGGGAVVVQSDVTWRRQMQDELSFRATHDELTRLPNRAALVDAIHASLARLDGGRKLAVLFCDLDGFKDINDGLGHAVGDQVLVAVARRLRQRCRQADIVARFGGDEFVVVLSVAEVGQAVAMADRIVEVLAEPIVVGEIEVAPGVSVGITVVDAPPDGDDPVGTLLRDADTAMYHAKSRGRGRYEFFDASLRDNIAERLELAAALSRAVGGDELQVVYQTRRHCGDRRIAGVEALLEWRHPVLGRVAPEVFIPIAERTGRIVEVGGWVLRRALSEFAAVADRRLTLAVNVSPRQLTSGRLVRTVAAALDDSGLDPARLILEITESAFVDDPEATRLVLAQLQRLGVAIALDDFGTGWSSLSYLRTLPVDVLKIDRSFVSDLPDDLAACAVVAAVLGLGHGMGLVIVAEGVETGDQLDTLREMGCDEYQGFLDGRPGPLADVLDLAGEPVGPREVTVG